MYKQSIAYFSKVAYHNLLFLIIFGASVLLFSSCGGDEVYTPKPRAYPKVDYPERAYEQFDKDYCSFTFEKPSYAQIVKDEDFFGEKPESECWFDLVIPALSGKIHCSYREIGKNKLDKLINDTYKLAHKHNIRADYIDEIIMNKPNKVHSTIFEIEGSAASPFQFYVTDSTDHFLRGALYFNTQPNPDSMKPVIEFVKKDLIHMMNTFEWTE